MPKEKISLFLVRDLFPSKERREGKEREERRIIWKKEKEGGERERKMKGGREGGIASQAPT